MAKHNKSDRRNRNREAENRVERKETKRDIRSARKAAEDRRRWGIDASW